MANIRKKISELTALTSASLDTVIVGVDNGTTYKIELDVLADGVVNRINALDVQRLNNLESVTSSFEVNGRNVISSSTQITNLGFILSSQTSSFITESETGSFITSIPSGLISSSTQISNFGFISSSIDITSLNSYTSSQDSRNVAFTNGINARLQTSSFNEFSASVNQRILDATNEQSFNGLVSGSSQLTSSYDSRYVISGSITQTTWDNIANKPNDIVSSSQQISDLGFVTGSYAYLTEFNSLTQSFNIISGSVVNITNAVDVAQLNNTTASLNSFTQSTNIRLENLEAHTSSYLTSLNGVISSSAQVLGGSGVVSGSYETTGRGIISSSANLLTTSSFNSYTASISTASLVTSITNLNVYTASQSTSSLVNRLNAIESVSGSWITESETGSLQTSITNLNSFTQSFSTSVDSRFDTLEATIISGSPNYTQVLGNRRTNITTTGVSIISGSITTTGNPVQIMITGDANPTSDGWTRLQIFRGESGIGNIIQVENSANQNVPYCLNVIDTPSAGTYTYSMRIVSGISGVFDFGEHTGPLLTAVELKTNTNLPSTNNTFSGTNIFTNETTLRGLVNIGTGSADEGGEIQLAIPQTNTSLTNKVIIDVYRNQLRLWEGGVNSKGVHIDLNKAPNDVGGELMWKKSGIVNAGTFVSLDNIKVTVTSSNPYGLSIAAVSTTFSANISAYHAYTGGIGGISTNNLSITTTPTTSLFNWSFPAEGDGSYYNILDKTNNRFYRITLMIGAGYNNNFISIERLY